MAAGQSAIPQRRSRKVAWTIGALVAVLGLVALALVGPGGGRTSTLRTPEGASNGWIIFDATVQRLQAAGMPASQLNLLFDNPSTYLVVNSESQAAAYPHATPVEYFQSEATLQEDYRQGTVFPNAVIMYDLEDHPQCPQDEIDNPVKAMLAAAQIVHAHHQRIILSPSQDVLQRASHEDDEGRVETFVASGIPAAVVRAADIYEFQVQTIEPDTAAYVTASQAAVSAVRREDPNATIFLGITDYPTHRPITVPAIVAPYEATKNISQGYWLNDPVQQSGYATNLLKQALDQMVPDATR